MLFTAVLQPLALNLRNMGLDLSTFYLDILVVPITVMGNIFIVVVPALA